MAVLATYLDPEHSEAEAVRRRSIAVTRELFAHGATPLEEMLLLAEVLVVPFIPGGLTPRLLQLRGR